MDEQLVKEFRELLKVADHEDLSMYVNRVEKALKVAKKLILGDENEKDTM